MRSDHLNKHLKTHGPNAQVSKPKSKERRSEQDSDGRPRSIKNERPASVGTNSHPTSNVIGHASSSLDNSGLNRASLPVSGHANSMSAAPMNGYAGYTNSGGGEFLMQMNHHALAHAHQAMLHHSGLDSNLGFNLPYYT